MYTSMPAFLMPVERVQERKARAAAAAAAKELSRCPQSVCDPPPPPVDASSTLPLFTQVRDLMLSRVRIDGLKVRW